MQEETQTRANHTRTDQAFIYFILPVLAIYFLWTLYRAGNLAVAVVRHRAEFPAGAFLHQAVLHYLLPAFAQIFIPLALLALAMKTRIYALRVQDRVIRLEERLRLSNLLPATSRERIHELSERQLIALRFASDAEVPALAVRAMDEHLEPRQIKDAITAWRPDHWRV